MKRDDALRDAKVEGASESPLVARRRDANGRWLVLHTRSRHEKSLATALRSAGVSCYVPLRRTQRPHGMRSIESTIPLFRGYVFLWGSRDELSVEDAGKRVATVLEVSDQPRLEWELLNVHRALSVGAAMEPCPSLRGGVRVRVASGSLEGVEGVVRDLGSTDRLILQIGMLGAAVGVDVHGELVEPLDN